MRRIPRWILCSAIAGILGAAAQSGSAASASSQQAIDRMKSENRGAKVSVNPATGTARFVRLGPASMLRLGTAPTEASAKAAAFGSAAAAFVDRNAAAFGLRNGSADLALQRSETDRLGTTRLTYAQNYRGVPVFGATLKAHFDATGRLFVLNGVLVPDIDVSTTPSRGARDAEAAAVEFVDREGSLSGAGRLVIYREGLVQGVPGANRLAYEVVVSNGATRDFVFVDAHSGKVIEKISGTMDGLYRRAFDGAGANPGPNYPASPFWVEGDSLPTGSAEANNMIVASKETYDLFFNGFGRDSFDGAGAIMDAIFNRGGVNQCPNASWNGTFISFCPGITTDDVTGHEWGHAYTEYTDGLIYAWQPGALNEAASDIFGETVDLLNGRDQVAGNDPRTGDACSVHTALPPVLTINSPAAIAGVKQAGSAAFGAQFFNVSGNVTLANDGGGATTSDGCEALVGFPAGDIALIDRGNCPFTAKAANAHRVGASAVIIANNAVGPAPGLGGADPTIVIPVMSLSLADAGLVKANFPVNATLAREFGSDNTARWLMGEDSTATGLVGALRDMWNPNCYGDPAKVTDSLYHCATSDNGGVHINSGVDNRAYSLLVDGGTFNGQTVTAIGLTKAAHIWYQAKVAYQHPATDFADHADALEQTCSDLTGVNLASLTTGAPSGEVISATDCAQVAKAVQAVEFRTPPTQCGFQPLLAKTPPTLCPPGKTAKKLFVDNFNNGTSSADRWIETHAGVTSDFTERDWIVVGNLPEGRAGKAFFGVDYQGGTCAPGGDESGVIHLDSPVITVPNTAPMPRISFDHWVATEAGYDGGNVKISVNGGSWQVIPASAFIYNAYNATLFTAGQGNTNPMAGQQAFTGSDGGSVDGSWGRSIIDLTGIAKKKDKIQLRFDVGTDGCGGTFGWYVDDLQVFQCR